MQGRKREGSRGERLAVRARENGMARDEGSQGGRAREEGSREERLARTVRESGRGRSERSQEGEAREEGSRPCEGSR